jgi:hypothetical protein
MLECKICGQQFVKNNIVSHIKHKHNITGAEYKEKYNSPVLIQSEETKKKLSESVTNNNYYSVQYWIKKGYSELEAREHIKLLGKKNSIRGIDFWISKGYTESEAREKVSLLQSQTGKRQKSSKHKWIAEGYSEEEAIKIASDFLKEKSFFHKEYWMNRHNLTEEESIEKISELQREFSSRSSKFSGKTRSDTEKKKISNSVKNHVYNVGVSEWIKHFGNFDNGRSLLEEEIYQYVKSRFHEVQNNISINNMVVDIVVNNKIIEVFGDYWHINPLLYEETDIVTYPGNKQILAKDKWESDNLRIDKLKKLGYDVLVVWEKDWRSDLVNTQQKILDFLYDN